MGASAKGGGERTPRAEAVLALSELVAAGAKPRAAASVLARLSGLRANELDRELTHGERP